MRLELLVVVGLQSRSLSYHCETNWLLFMTSVLEILNWLVIW